MLIILDYDQTYTLDPDFWLDFARKVVERGHAIVCCTMRTDAEVGTMCPRLRKRLTVVNTSRAAKREFLLAAGYDLTNAVWIDDSPHWILTNSR